jgi:hypothetical protein
MKTPFERHTHTNLVGGLEHDFLFFHSVGNVIIPTDKLIFFIGVETTNQKLMFFFSRNILTVKKPMDFPVKPTHRTKGSRMKIEHQ